MAAPKGAIRVEVSLLSEAQGGRRTGVNMSDGRYRPILIAGSRSELSEEETQGRGQYKMFGVGFTEGPETVLPGDTVTVTIFAFAYPEGIAEIAAAGVFSVCEGRHIVGNGRVLEPPSTAG